MSQENKRVPNKPALLTITKRTPSNKNIKKHSTLSSPLRNKNSPDIHSEVFSLHPKHQKEKQEKYKLDFSNNSSFSKSFSSQQIDQIISQRSYLTDKPYDTNQDKNIHEKFNQKEISLDYYQNNPAKNHNSNQNYIISTSSNDNILNTDNSNAELGEEIRKIFKEKSDNDIIIKNIKIFIEFIESMKLDVLTEDNYDFASFIFYLKSQNFENSELKKKNDEILRKSEDFELKLNDLIFQYGDTNKSDNQTALNSDQILQLFERDLNFSMSVRNIFNEHSNDEAILRTIQSNKETAVDNQTIIELSSQIHQLGEIIEVNKKISFQKINDEHQQELAAKEVEIQKLTQIITDLKQENDEERQKHEDEVKQIETIKNQFISENNDQINFIKQSYETQLNKYKEEMSENKIYSENILKTSDEQKVLIEQKDNEINQYKQKNTEQENLIEQKQNEIDQIKTQNTEQKSLIEQKNDELFQCKEKNAEQKFLIDQKDIQINQIKEELMNKDSIANQLRRDLFNQQRINEETQKENKELKNFIKNNEDIKDKEIDYLKKELLASLEKQKKIENQLNKLTGKCDDVDQKKND